MADTAAADAAAHGRQSEYWSALGQPIITRTGGVSLIFSRTIYIRAQTLIKLLSKGSFEFLQIDRPRFAPIHEPILAKAGGVVQLS